MQKVEGSLRCRTGKIRRNGEDVAALFPGKARGDGSAASRSGFDDADAERKSGNETVADEEKA